MSVKITDRRSPYRKSFLQNPMSQFFLTTPLDILTIYHSGQITSWNIKQLSPLIKGTQLLPRDSHYFYALRQNWCEKGIFYT